MKLIELAIKRPVAVMSIVLMTVLLGWLALQTIPIQLTPDARKPLVIVQTIWRGAAPAEVEREIVNRQEDVLKGLEGLERMESQASSGRAQIIIDGGFMRGADILKALALGADTVAIGKLQGLGLSAAGAQGVVRVLELLETEMRTCLGLLGATSNAELDASLLHPAPPVYEPRPLNAFPFLDPRSPKY